MVMFYSALCCNLLLRCACLCIAAVRLQSMVQDEQTMRLIDLHKYEAARRLPVSDEVYRANANILLHDEPCYRCAQQSGAEQLIT